jgi:hypothetical protein
MIKQRRSIVGGKVMPADLQRLHKELLEFERIDQSRMNCARDRG